MTTQTKDTKETAKDKLAREYDNLTSCVYETMDKKEWKSGLRRDKAAVRKESTRIQKTEANKGKQKDVEQKDKERLQKRL